MVSDAKTISPESAGGTQDLWVALQKSSVVRLLKEQRHHTPPEPVLMNVVGAGLSLGHYVNTVCSSAF